MRFVGNFSNEEINNIVEARDRQLLRYTLNENDTYWVKINNIKMDLRWTPVQLELDCEPYPSYRDLGKDRTATKDLVEDTPYTTKVVKGKTEFGNVNLELQFYRRRTTN